MKILGIETSCDETAAAVVENGSNMLSNIVASSVDLHTAYGGVVPEIAARSHVESIIPVIDEALSQAITSWAEIDAIAVTVGPGLMGSLLVGVLTARTLAIAKKKPLLPVNHVQAHLYATFITKTPLNSYNLPDSAPSFPLLALIVSGGHSQIVFLESHKKYRLLGQTLDDAIGEAYDKVAKILGLPYPGGPSIAKLAPEGHPTAIKLPHAKLANPYDFSFSGLKTAVLRASQSLAGKDFTLSSSLLPELLNEAQKADIAASFEATAVDTLVRTLEKAAEKYSPATVVLAGGVAANQFLRAQVESTLSLKVIYPDIKLCTDNAAMIAAAAYFIKPKAADPYNLEVMSGLKM